MQKAPKKDMARCLRISELGGASYAELMVKVMVSASVANDIAEMARAAGASPTVNGVGLPTSA